MEKAKNLEKVKIKLINKEFSNLDLLECALKEFFWN